MNDFIQMDIFFFITSIIAVAVLFFILVIGIYVVIIIKKIKKVVREFESFMLYATDAGKESLNLAKEKFEDILSQSSVLERVIATVLGTILAKSFKGRGKIKKDAPKE